MLISLSLSMSISSLAEGSVESGNTFNVGCVAASRMETWAVCAEVVVDVVCAVGKERQQYQQASMVNVQQKIFSLNLGHTFLRLESGMHVGDACNARSRNRRCMFGLHAFGVRSSEFGDGFAFRDFSELLF